MNLDALFDDLLTSGVTLADPQRLRRLRVLNTVHLVVMMAAPFLGLFYFYTGTVILFYVAVMTGLLMATSLLLLRKTKNIILMGNYTIAILWVFVFLVSWNTGGITYEGVLNPSWTIKGCLILLAVFLTGYLYGTIWTMIAFFEVGLIVYLYQIRFQFPQGMPYELAALYHLVTFLLGFLIIVLFAFLFESDREEALIREQVKAQAFQECKKIIDDIFERSPVPTFLIDQNHRVVQWNTACQKLTGLSAGEVLGKGVWEGFSMSDGKSLADMVLDNPLLVEERFPDAILSRPESGCFELNIFLPNLKGGRQAVVTASRMTDPSGTVLGALQSVCVPDSYPAPARTHQSPPFPSRIMPPKGLRTR
ncbi:MAG: PAS domain-containing protein [Desulfatiglandales bacterium]